MKVTKRKRFIYEVLSREDIIEEVNNYHIYLLMDFLEETKPEEANDKITKIISKDNESETIT